MRGSVRAYQATANLGRSGLVSLLIGNAVTRQASGMVVDDVAVRLEGIA